MSNTQEDYPEYIEKVIAGCVHDPENLFVFPSEVVAESWHLKVLESGELKAVRRDNFVSWDRLKERYFSPRKESRPANLTTRTLFASGLLGNKDRDTFPFEEMINPEYPEQAPRFTKWISSLLPQLKTAVGLIEKEGENLPQAYIRDITFLYREYSRFLSESGLFEPSWQEPDPRGISGKGHIFFPELIEDFDEYGNLLSEKAGFFVYPMGAMEAAAEGPATGILRFSSAWEELEFLLDTIGSLLSAGTAPGDIAVTLPAYDSWMPYLREGAVLRGIPIQFRSGSPLTSFPVGRLFRELKELSDGGFSLSGMKNLFLDPVYPWRRPEQWREIIAFGVEHSCVRTFKGPEGFYDPWKVKLEKAGRRRLKGLYESFSFDLRALLKSRSFGELNAQMVGFLTSWFEDSLWRPEERNVLQYALLQLREAADAESRLYGEEPSDRGSIPGSVSASDPYSLWLSILDQRVYVPKASGPGVPAYRYRVAAGSYPGYHFIAGAGQEETRCVCDSLAFLREDRRGGIAGGSKDLSAPFLEAYMKSGHRVFCSCSDAGFGGPQLPPAEFLSTEASVSGALGGVLRGKPDKSGGRFNLYRGEQEGWTRTADFPSRLYPLQVEGYRRIRVTGLDRKGHDYTEGLIESPPLLKSVFKVLRKKNDVFRFSPHSFDTYRGCGFAFFLTYALGIEEKNYEAVYEDRLTGGMLTHRVFQLFFNKIVEEGGVYEPERVESYREHLREALAEGVKEYEEVGIDLFPPEWRRLVHSLEERLDRFPEAECAAFPGFLAEDTEEKYWVDLPGGIGFSGRIDRISTLDGRPAVVDYKSGEVPKKSAYSSPEGVPEQTQMPIYLLLAEGGQKYPPDGQEREAEAGETSGFGESRREGEEERRKRREAAALSYYSVKNGCYTHLLYDGPGEAKETLGREELEGLAERVAEEARRVRSRIEAGNFTVPEDCEPCAFRPICRVKYSIRSGKQ
ncbi:MAG: PD-(D/E)XK nuclease family protein [Spirochaetaceae bacterium]